MGIEEYFGKNSRPLNYIKDSLLEWNESLSNYNIIRKIVIVDVKHTGTFGHYGETLSGNIDLILILKTGELRFKNINKSMYWVGDYTTDHTNYVSIATNQVTKTEDIIGVKLVANGCFLGIHSLNVQVATVSGSRSPIIIGKELNNSTDEFKTLDGLRTLIDTSSKSPFDFFVGYVSECTPTSEFIPTIPSAPKAIKPDYSAKLKAGNPLTIKWKKPDFDGHLDILRYEVWSSVKSVWMDAGLNKDSDKIFTYDISYDEWTWCDNIKIRAVNAKGPGLELDYYLNDSPT